jgi:hypothetical protein
MLPTTGRWRIPKAFSTRAKSLLNIRLIVHTFYPPVKTVLTIPKEVPVFKKYYSRNISKTDQQINSEVSACDLNYIRLTKYRKRFRWWDYPHTVDRHCSDSSHKRSSSLFKNMIIKQALECNH